MQREGVCIDIRVESPWQRGQSLTMGEGKVPSFGPKGLLKQTAALLIPTAVTLLKCLSEGQTFEMVKVRS